MAIVQAYPQGTPTLNDTVIGTQYIENQEPATKNFDIGDILALAPVVQTALPYKVFTVLLTQSGGSVPSGINWDDNPPAPLVIGVTYNIQDNGGGLDMTNVGAPNNEIGTYFIATGTTPNSWGQGAVTYNTGAPVATVLENTIGNVWFTYNSADTYFINSYEKFTVGKTWVVAGNVFGDTMSLPVVISPNFNNSYMPISYIKDGITQNGYLYNTPIEIRVYN